MQENKKAIGKKVFKESSNDIRKKVCKRELGKGKGKDVG